MCVCVPHSPNIALQLDTLRCTLWTLSTGYHSLGTVGCHSLDSIHWIAFGCHSLDAIRILLHAIHSYYSLGTIHYSILQVSISHHSADAIRRPAEQLQINYERFSERFCGYIFLQSEI